MLQILNCRSIIINLKLLKTKKILFYFFFYQLKKIKNKNLIKLFTIFYQSRALLLNLLISNYQRQRINHFLLLKKNATLGLNIFKKNFIFKNEFLTDIAVYDVPGKTNRFTLTIMLQSTNYNTRMEIIIKTNETSPITSLYNVFGSACWVEREIWDLFGIFFVQHNDLRRILTDYNFEGHPLRKDFPLSGYTDIFYDDKYKKIVYTPIELSQEYRVFNFKNIWKNV